MDGNPGSSSPMTRAKVPFDLAVVVPAPRRSAVRRLNSEGLGDGLGFVAVDRAHAPGEGLAQRLGIGDAAACPTSKAGSVTHFEGEVLVENSRVPDGEALDASFDGHANCFIEIGSHKALLIDFNYETEPLPGHYPGPSGFLF